MKTPSERATPALIELRSVGKSFDSVVALEDVSVAVRAGEVTCLLGDNGAGKSTLVSIVSGVQRPSSGTMHLDGSESTFTSPRDAMAQGVATVHQTMALLPLMSVWRNFVLGAEPTIGWGPLRRLNRSQARAVAASELARLGIHIPDPDRAVGTMSGGERQSLAIARALYSGARVLILDEPTAALGVKQAEIVLRSISEARDRGIAVVLVTHNPRHAATVGDHFVVLNRGRVIRDELREAVTVDQLTQWMAGIDV